MDNIKIIDGHSHIGIDKYWKNEGILEEYIKNIEKSNIEESFLMSVPCPVIRNESGFLVVLSTNKIVNNEIKHFRIEEKNGEKKYIPVCKGCNPYKEANKLIYKESLKSDKVKINYVPLIHPYYYSVEDFKEQIEKGAKMFKIHGIASGVIPEKISKHFFEIIELLQIPLIIHTDLSDSDNIFSWNSAEHWLKVLEPYSIKAYFAHAVRLSKDAVEIVNNDDRYLVGLGPTRLMSSKEYNSKHITNYIDYCLDCFDLNKMVFDIDYPWNIKSPNNYDFDWTSLDYIKNKLNKNQKEKILSKNLINFIGGKNEKN